MYNVSIIVTAKTEKADYLNMWKTWFEVSKNSPVENPIAEWLTEPTPEGNRVLKARFVSDNYEDCIKWKSKQKVLIKDMPGVLSVSIDVDELYSYKIEQKEKHKRGFVLEGDKKILGIFQMSYDKNRGEVDHLGYQSCFIVEELIDIEDMEDRLKWLIDNMEKLDDIIASQDGYRMDVTFDNNKTLVMGLNDLVYYPGNIITPRVYGSFPSHGREFLADHFYKKEAVVRNIIERIGKGNLEFLDRNDLMAKAVSAKFVSRLTGKTIAFNF